MKKFIINKRNIFLIIIGLMLIILFSLFLSYSYVSSRTDTNIIADVNVKSTSQGGLNIVGSGNLGILEGDYYGTITPTLWIEAGTDGPKIEEYDLYLELFDNTIVYTTEEEYPEVIFKVKDHTGTEITELPGFRYVEVDGIGDNEVISGFDVTGFTGKIPLRLNEEIMTSIEYNGGHTWEFSIYYVDLLNEQTENNGNSITGELVFEVGEITNKLHDEIISNAGGLSKIKSTELLDFTKAVTTIDYRNNILDNTKFHYDTTSGLYEKEGNYFFRGVVENNWVYFAGYYWRIVRINSDGTIRLLYSGVNAPTLEERLYKKTDTSIEVNKFNLENNVADKINYQSSNIKNILDTWYNDNITSYGSYVTSTKFCIDTSSYSRLVKVYDGIEFTTGLPVYTCPVAEITYNIGLLNADEVISAGMVPGMSNIHNYLYSPEGYYTLSPVGFNESIASVFSVADGVLKPTDVATDLGLRPVINLKSDVYATGSGVYNEPYTITDPVL